MTNFQELEPYLLEAYKDAVQRLADNPYMTEAGWMRKSNSEIKNFPAFRVLILDARPILLPTKQDDVSYENIIRKSLIPALIKTSLYSFGYYSL